MCDNCKNEEMQQGFALSETNGAKESLDWIYTFLLILFSNSLLFRPEPPRTENEEMAFLKGKLAAYEKMFKERDNNGR